MDNHHRQLLLGQADSYRGMRFAIERLRSDGGGYEHDRITFNGDIVMDIIDKDEREEIVSRLNAAIAPIFSAFVERWEARAADRGVKGGEDGRLDISDKVRETLLNAREGLKSLVKITMPRGADATYKSTEEQMESVNASITISNIGHLLGETD